VGIDVEVRLLTQDDLEQAFRLDQQVFNLPDDRRELWIKWAVPEREHGAFSNGKLAAAAYVHAFGQFFGGRSVPMGGVGGVAVAPEHRGKGLARRVMTEALQAMRARGEVISALFPATTSLYRGVGYELAGAAVWHQVSPRALRELRAPSSLETRRVDQDESPEGIRHCYQRVAPGINGWVDRGDRRWQAQWEWWHQQHQVYACQTPDGEVDGYLVYRHEPTPPGAVGDYGLRVDQLVAATPEAMRALWWTLASHASLVDAVTFTASPEDALLLLMPEQRMSVRAQVRWMLRIVDAPGAMAARGFPPSLEIEVPLVVEDAILPDNAGAWTLRVAKGEGLLERGGEGGPRLGIGALSSLYAGWASSGTLARTGLLQGGSPTQLRALDAAFAGPTPWMMDEF
jgi:predicted acetyltransferase